MSDRRLFALPDPSEVDPDFDLYDRAEAAQIARDLLVVKGGKYAERPVETWDVIALAEWLLYGSPEDDADEPEAETVTEFEFINDGVCICGKCR